jgi:Tol biopolymer transport system component
MHACGSTAPRLETNAAQLAISDNATLVFLPGGIYPEEHRLLTWVDRAGSEERLDLPLRHYNGPRLSPDGQRLAVTARGGFNTNVIIVDRVRGTRKRLTAPGEAGMGVWTSDGRRYCFSLLSGGSACRLVDLSREIEPLTESEYWHFPSSWTPDGKILAYVEIKPDTGPDIWLLDLEAGGEPTPLIQTPADEEYPEFSPDGRWLAYMSDETGQDEIFVQSFPEAGQRIQISTNGGFQPLWSKNGKELFYSKDDQVLAVDIETDGGFAAGRPRILFDGNYIIHFPLRGYDISIDGERFLMVGREPYPGTPITHPHVVFNWYQELLEKVPVK